MKFSESYFVVIFIIAGLCLSFSCKNSGQIKPYESYEEIVKAGKDAAGKTAILEIKFESAATGDMVFVTKKSRGVVLVWDDADTPQMDKVVKSGNFHKIEFKIDSVEISGLSGEVIKVH